MTDLLARLAARHMGEARLLQPQLPGIFEPQGDAGQTLVEETAERPAPPPRTAQATRPEPEAHRDETTEQMPGPADPPRDAEPEPAPPKETVRIRPDEAPGPPPVQHVTHETHRDVVHETQRFTHHEHIRTADPEDGRPAPEDGPQVTDPVAPDTDPPATATREREHRDPPKPVEPLPQPVVQALPPQEPHAVRTEFPSTQERRVEVHIGHLEIRTTTPPKPKARPRRSAANPAPDLNTYLGGRS